MGAACEACVTSRSILKTASGVWRARRSAPNCFLRSQLRWSRRPACDGVGVTVSATYQIKRIDSDYFSET